MADRGDVVGGIGGGLTFRWERPVWVPLLRLVGFVFLSLFFHAGFFYLFRVVYPAAERVLPEPSSVVLLHERNPMVVPVLRAIDDRESAFMSSVMRSASGDLELGGYPEVLGEGVEGLDYRRSYEGHEPALREWPAEAAMPALPPVSQPGEVRLPAPGFALGRRSGDSPVPAVGERRVVVRAGGGLADRPIESQPAVDFGDWPSPGGGRVVFSVGVERRGQVAYAVVTDGGGVADLERVRRFVGGVKFEGGRVGEGLEWGTMEVTW